MAAPSRMRAQVMEATGAPLVLRQVPRPEPGFGEIRVRLDACGLCHSDLHILNGDWGQPSQVPLVLGHEGVGVVEAVGEGCGPEPGLGARVGVPWIHATCGRCRECLSGHETFCQATVAHGFDRHGCYADAVIARQDRVAVLPSGLDSFAAAPLMCAGLTAYAAVRKAALEPGRVVAIFGCGGLGLFAVQFALLTGATVVAVDLDEGKLARAAGYGALAARPDEAVEVLAGLGGADACLDFATALGVFRQMLAAVRPLGRIVIVAEPPGEVLFEMKQLAINGATITGSALGSRQELKEVLALAARGAIESVVEKVPFADTNAALTRLAGGQVVGRLVLDISGGRK